MLKTITWAGFAAVILGAILASEPIPIPKALPSGLFIAGIGLAAAFLDALLTGEISFSPRSRDSYSYRGIAARLWGAEMAFIGGSIAFIALREWFSPGWALAWVKSPLGLAQLLLAGGLVIANAGLVMMLGTTESRENKTAFLLSLPLRLFGLVVLFAGLAALGLGIIQLAVPGAVGAWIRDTIPPIPTPPVINSFISAKVQGAHVRPYS